MNVEIPAAQFDEFLYKFGEFLDKPEPEMVSGDLKRIPTALDHISSGIRDLSSALKRMKPSMSVVNNTETVKQIQTNTKETVNNTEVIWEETANGNVERLESQSVTHKILRQIRDKAAPVASTGMLDGVMAALSSIVDHNKERKLYSTKRDAKSSAIAINSVRFLARIAGDGTILKDTLESFSKSSTESLASLSETYQGVAERIAREDAEKDDKREKKSFLANMKNARLSRMAFAQMDSVLSTIKNTLIDARLMMFVSMFKNFAGTIGKGFVGLFKMFGRIPIIGKALMGVGNIAGIIGRGIGTIVSTLFSPASIMTMLRIVTGPVGIAVGAAGAAFYAMFSEELNGLFGAVLDFLGDPERISNVIDNFMSMFDGVADWSSNIAKDLGSNIKESLNNIFGFFYTIPGQISSISTEATKWMADKLRALPFGDEIADAIGLDTNEGYQAKIDQKDANTDYNNKFDYVKWMGDPISEYASGAKDDIKHMFNSYTDVMMKDLAKAGAVISGGITSMTESINQVGKSGTIKAEQHAVDKAKKVSAAAAITANTQNNQTQVNSTTITSRPISASTERKM